ncbi:family 16 glycosylhydrolase [Pseudonocardia nematodicida]|uniref:Family 16 glycosylhydrolase n=1 Tax=Pseudonocardia nematodicida TaxID=1206997 RepID=A0ABV1KLZ1_9PSEU
MTADELERLLTRLVTQGMTVLVLLAGSGGQAVEPAPDGTGAPVSLERGAPGADDPRCVLTVPGDAVATGSGDAPAGEAGDDDAGDTPDPDAPDPDTPDPDATDLDDAARDQAPGDSGIPGSGRPDTAPPDGERDPGRRDGAGSRTAEDPCPTGPGAAAPSGDGSTGSSRDTAGSGVTGGTAADGPTAAERFGWGQPVRADDFDGDLSSWSIYDGPGHAGNGRRTPDAVSVADGVLTITGDGDGNTAGMAWTGGSQQYGRWEGRVRAPASDPSYNALLLLWPTAENFPVGGEIDFMEMMDPSRQRTDIFVHYGPDNSQIHGEVEIDGTTWRNWAVEWTPEHITAYVDGEEWFTTTDPQVQPPGPMHLCIQLDWFPSGDSVQESRMEVDWVRQYTLDS